jgi:hypothetical protein
MRKGRQASFRRRNLANKAESPAEGKPLSPKEVEALRKLISDLAEPDEGVTNSRSRIGTSRGKKRPGSPES